jgi:hypothetical protein
MGSPGRFQSEKIMRRTGAGGGASEKKRRGKKRTKHGRKSASLGLMRWWWWRFGHYSLAAPGYGRMMRLCRHNLKEALLQQESNDGVVVAAESTALGRCELRWDACTCYHRGPAWDDRVVAAVAAGVVVEDDADDGADDGGGLEDTYASPLSRSPRNKRLSWNEYAVLLGMEKCRYAPFGWLCEGLGRDYWSV